MDLQDRLEKLEKRLDSLESLVYDIKGRIKILENLAFASKPICGLPNHLLTTLLAVYKLGRATASEIANETKKERAVESAYLNQLTTMGYLKKEREDRKIYFEINYESKTTRNLLKFLEIQRK